MGSSLNTFRDRSIYNFKFGKDSALLIINTGCKLSISKNEIVVLKTK